MVKIEIRTKNKEQIFNSIVKSNLKPHVGQKYEIDGGIELVYLEGFENNFINSETITFILASIGSVSINIFSSYIYDKLKDSDKSNKLIINGIEVEISENEIRKILQILHKEKKK